MELNKRFEKFNSLKMIAVISSPFQALKNKMFVELRKSLLSLLKSINCAKAMHELLEISHNKLFQDHFNNN